MQTGEGQGNCCQSVLKGRTEREIAAELMRGWMEVINRLERQSAAAPSPLPREGDAP